MLAGCGGGESSTSTQAGNPGIGTGTGPDEPAVNGGKEGPAKSGSPHGEKRDRSSSKPDAGSPQKNGSGDAGGTNPAASGGRDGKRGGDKDDPTQLDTNNCPRGTSNEDCAKVKALEQSNPKSQVRTVDECPAAMSSSECAEAGKSFEEAKSGGHVVSPNECPRAMTAEQCAEAGKAYEEATK
jgi:hypothetical protein